jgi:hypothetical protein
MSHKRRVVGKRTAAHCVSLYISYLTKVHVGRLQDKRLWHTFFDIFYGKGSRKPLGILLNRT